MAKAVAIAKRFPQRGIALLSNISFVKRNGKSANGHRSDQAPKVAHSIIHTIPGRVRFRVPRLRDDPDYAKRLQT